LGHVVSADGVTTDSKKIEAVQDWPIPQNKKQLRLSWVLFLLSQVY